MGVSAFGAVAGVAVYEGDGHEIRLEGDDDEYGEKGEGAAPAAAKGGADVDGGEVVEFRGRAGPAVGTP
jgi:hypothetical protein